MLNKNRIQCSLIKEYEKAHLSFVLPFDPLDLVCLVHLVPLLSVVLVDNSYDLIYTKYSTGFLCDSSQCKFYYNFFTIFNLVQLEIFEYKLVHW